MKIIKLATPTNNKDVTNKAYVDNAIKISSPIRNKLVKTNDEGRLVEMSISGFDTFKYQLDKTAFLRGFDLNASKIKSFYPVDLVEHKRMKILAVSIALKFTNENFPMNKRPKLLIISSKPEDGELSVITYRLLSYTGCKSRLMTHVTINSGVMYNVSLEFESSQLGALLDAAGVKISCQYS